MRSRFVIVLIAAGIARVPPSSAQVAAPGPGLVVEIGGPGRPAFRIGRVERVEGPWLRLVDERGGGRGRARSDEVIPIDRAIDYCTDQIRANPGSDLARARRALILARLGEYDRALIDYDEAIRLNPNDPASYLGRGEVWKAKGDDVRARADYDKAGRLRAYVPYLGRPPRLQPAGIANPAGFYLDRGLEWQARGDDDRAIIDLSEAIRLDPESAPAYDARGTSWRLEGDYARALADFDKALALSPTYAVAANNRAWLRATCPDAKYRDANAAVAGATRACDLTGWKNPNFLDTLAAAHAERGDFQKAIYLQQRALGLCRGDEPHFKRWRDRIDVYKSETAYRETP